MSQKAEGSFVSFILIGVATITTIYWVRVIKKMLKNVKPKYTAREAEAKNWVYDLIKGEKQFVFVAEVPGPDDKIMVRFFFRLVGQNRVPRPPAKITQYILSLLFFHFNETHINIPIGAYIKSVRMDIEPFTRLEWIS